MGLNALVVDDEEEMSAAMPQAGVAGDKRSKAEWVMHGTGFIERVISHHRETQIMISA